MSEIRDQNTDVGEQNTEGRISLISEV